MREYKSLSFEEQIDLFESRGMIFEDKIKAINKLKFINYYKLKEFSFPFMEKQADNSYKYKNITFNDLLKRYYQDKHIRLALMSCLEKIEIAFKTRFCHLLGSKHGAFGYLKFNNWCNKDKYCKYYIEEKQGEFKKHLKENADIYNKTKCIHTFFQECDNETEKIPIWMLVEVLTFGHVLQLCELMSTENRKKIANDFDCNVDEFFSWLNTIRYIRNQCAHNLNVIDTKLKTKPTLRKEWKSFILLDQSNATSGGLADVVFPIVYLTIKINNKYSFNDLRKGIRNLISNDEEKAKMLGFKDVKSAIHVIDYLVNIYVK